MAGNFDSWEDAAAQDDDLSRQAQQNLNINANSFRPGAASFQPGASSFQPGQQYQSNGYQQPYGYGQQQQQFNQYPQYQQQQQQNFNQYPQYQQQQQQPPQPSYNQNNNNSQFAAYNQTPGGFQPRQGAPISIAKRQDAPAASTQQPAAQQAKAQAPAPAPVPAPAASTAKPPPSAAPPKVKVLSIGVPTSTSTTPKKPASPTTKEAPAKEAGSKAAAAKAVEKTGEKVTGKSSPAPSSGKSSPTPGESKKGQTAEELAQEQSADVDASVLQEMYGKEHVNIIFIGHVDAGKSTLGGQVLIQTGMVDERTLDKYKRDAKDAGRETWYISWVLDLNKEERAKGKTVEVGRGFSRPKSADTPSSMPLVTRLMCQTC